MKTLEEMQENVISAKNQNKKEFYGDRRDNARLKILFVGNSITKHAPKPEINWNRDCGMAASCLENDYVHVCMSKVRELVPDADFSILQVAGYEWSFYDKAPEENYSRGRDYAPDIVIMFFGANVSKDYDTNENPKKTFFKAYEDLRNMLDTGNTFFMHSQGFYIRPKLDAEKQAVAEKYGDVFVNIEDIRTREDTHGGWNHPSDLGMRLIAERFFDAISGEVKKYAKD